MAAQKAKKAGKVEVAGLARLAQLANAPEASGASPATEMVSEVALTKERQHFDQLFGSVQQTLYAYIQSYLPTGDEADDVMQETAIALWNKFDQYDAGKSHFSAWAKSFARFEVINFLKRRGQRKLKFDTELIDLISEDFELMENAIDDRYELLNDCLKLVSDEKRELILKRYLQDYSIKQLAEETGRNKDAIYKAITRTEARLMKCVESKRALKQAKMDH